MEKLLCLKTHVKERGTIFCWIVTAKITSFYYCEKEKRTYVSTGDGNTLTALWFPGDQTEKIIAAITGGEGA